MKIKFETIDDVKEFNKIACKIKRDVDLKCNRYIVDAKSIMGILALNLSEELEVITSTEKDEELFKEWRVE